MTAPAEFSLQCPLPAAHSAVILMAHGGGGRLTQQLLDRVFYPAFGNPYLQARHDGAALEVGGHRLAFTTDSFVVQPLFFPGGDIGKLAVCGTVNDLAMCGARPRWLSAGFIIEEGLPIETLDRVVTSMKTAAQAAGVIIVTGDTKVVDKGKGDGLFINTAGIGLIETSLRIDPGQVRPGDAIILNGDVGRHGLAVLSLRQGLELETAIESDCAPLIEPVHALLAAGIEVRCLRDLTRGGLASAVNEIATVAGVDIELDEAAIPVNPEVRGASEILGLDPLYIANEGRFVAFVPPGQLAEAVAALRALPGVNRRSASAGSRAGPVGSGYGANWVSCGCWIS